MAILLGMPRACEFIAPAQPVLAEPPHSTSGAFNGPLQVHCCNSKEFHSTKMVMSCCVHCAAESVAWSHCHQCPVLWTALTWQSYTMEASATASQHKPLLLQQPPWVSVAGGQPPKQLQLLPV